MNKLAVKGGIGDFLQFLPFMLTHPEYKYLAASHYGKVREFFASFGLRVRDLSLGRLAGIDACPRSLSFFENNPFPEVPPIFPKRDKPVIGIQIGGSDYSLSIEKRFGFPPKALPAAVIDRIVANTQYNYLLFVAPDEFPFAEIKIRSNLRFVCTDDVVLSLAHVAECSGFIGSDSAFKTMSSMLRIPTVVWVGNYRDDFRDENFLNPYVKAGEMGLFHYNDLNSEDEIRAGVDFSLKWLESRCGLKAA